MYGPSSLTPVWIQITDSLDYSIAARTPEDKRSPLAPAADDIVRRAGTLPVFTNPPTDGTEDADEKLRRAGTLPVFTNPPTPGTEEDDVALPFFTNPQPLDDTDKKLRRRDIGLPVFTNPQPGDGE